jgi:hypothetical protein
MILIIYGRKTTSPVCVVIVWSGEDWWWAGQQIEEVVG